MRKSNRSMVLMEIMLSILILCLVSSVCLQLFAKAKTMSQQAALLAEASTTAANLAESFLTGENLNSFQEGDIEYNLIQEDGSLSIQCVVDDACIYKLVVVGGH